MSDEDKLRIAIEALEFYAQAKILFFTTDASTWKAANPGEGIASGGLAPCPRGNTHYKDDGDRARQALKAINSA